MNPANDHPGAQHPDGTRAPEAPAGRPRWLRRFMAVLVSSVLALLAGELVTRLFYTDEMLNVQTFGFQAYHVTEGYELVPNTEEGNVRINSLGYRDRELSVERPASTTRILIVGDSVVFGTGVNLEDTFSKRLETMLRSKRRDPIEVINGGNPDTGLTEIARIFRKRDMKMKPDVALLCFYMNDSRPPMGFRSEFVRGDPLVRLVKRNPWLRRSMLFSSAYFLYYNTAIRKEVDKLPVSLRPQWAELFQQETAWKSSPAVLNELIEAAEFDWGAAWRPETWPRVIEQLRELDEVARASGIRMGLVIMPVKVQVYGAVVRDEPQKRLRKTAKELGWPCLDLLPGLIERRDGAAIFNDHCHYSPQGHKLVAGLILEFLKSQALLGTDGGKAE